MNMIFRHPPSKGESIVALNIVDTLEGQEQRVVVQIEFDAVEQSYTLRGLQKQQRAVGVSLCAREG